MPKIDIRVTRSVRFNRKTGVCEYRGKRCDWLVFEQECDYPFCAQYPDELGVGPQLEPYDIACCWRRCEPCVEEFG